MHPNMLVAIIVLYIVVDNKPEIAVEKKGAVSGARQGVGERHREPGFSDAAFSRGDGHDVAPLRGAHVAGRSKRNRRHAMRSFRCGRRAEGVPLSGSGSKRRDIETGLSAPRPLPIFGLVLTLAKRSRPASAAESRLPRRRAMSSRVAMSRV